LQVPSAEGALAERRQGSSMAGIDFENSAPERNGLFVPPPLRSPCGLRFEGVYLLPAGLDVLHPLNLPA
jgi:hypothetical protein